ncbi:MAG: glucosylceramidase, partial [Crocinitomicaceae bacterium]|nr:glucosylceramidase [Crocinitomicaceae bacterium]
MLKNMTFFTLLSLSFALFNCSSSTETIENPTPSVKPPIVTNDMDFWLTNGSKNVYLQKQTAVLSFGTNYNIYPTIEVDEVQSYQTIDGFGYTLTGGSAEGINKLNPQKRQALLQELFGKEDNSISISYLRISIGASDLNATPFTYD